MSVGAGAYINGQWVPDAVERASPLGRGYAVAEKDQPIDPRTVAMTKVGAMVNWLLVRHKVMAQADWADDVVARAFTEAGGGRVVKVMITEVG